MQDRKVNEDNIVYCLKRAFINPFSIILFILGGISLVTDIFMHEGFHKNYTSVIIIFFMLLVSGTVRFIQELKSRQVVDRLTKLINTKVLVLQDDKWCEKTASDLDVGDKIKVSAGDRVPADIKITLAESLHVSQSVITGESAVVEKYAAVSDENISKLTSPECFLFEGTTVTGGTGIGIVVDTGKNTVYGGINTKRSDKKRGFDKGANSIAWVLIRFMAVLVPVVFLACGLTKGNWIEALLFALSVAVGLTPELLPMVVNACLARGSHLMGKKQTVVKNINAMQGFGSMDVLCVDKTGTLTGDKVILEYYMDILGNESRKALDYAFLASFYNTGVGNHLDSAIINAKSMPGKEHHYNELIEKHQKIDEKPFDHDLRLSGVLTRSEESNLLIIKGSLEEIIERCNRKEYKGTVYEINKEESGSTHAVVDEMLEDGMKVIAVAYKYIDSVEMNLEKESDFILLGFLAFFDAPKQSAASAVKKLKEQSVNVKVLTGDQKLVAESICSRLGLGKDQIITGAELDEISENELPIVVEKTNVFAELTPKQKKIIVDTLQTNGHTVGFLGDGMNDLPAIMQGDVGISVENAVDAVKECADVILLKKDLNVLEEGIIEGRKAFANMSKYIKITASSNFGNICAIVIASVLLPFFPMTGVQLLLLNLLYDILCLVIPWDNVDIDLLVKPLEWSGKKLGSFMSFFGPLSSVFDLITFAFLFFVLCPSVCGGAFASLSVESQQLFISVFQTGWFLESMWTQVLILQLLRTKHLPFVQSKPGKMVVVFTIIGIILFTMLPLTPLGGLLGLCRMPRLYYVFLIAVVVWYLLFVTLMKWLYVKKTDKLI